MSNLVLSRRIGEKVMISDKENGLEVILTIVGINRNQVKLSLIAPLSVNIHREEIHNKIHNLG